MEPFGFEGNNIGPVPPVEPTQPIKKEPRKKTPEEIAEENRKKQQKGHDEPGKGRNVDEYA